MYTQALSIVRTLYDAGFTAYFAGGCVRDMLLGLEPKDYDIVTSATPEEVENLFQKTVPIGKKFGVMLVLEGGFSFEVATFRSDCDYTDGRRPDRVEFCNPLEDASRRDFTINGMFYDPITKQVIDHVDGKRYLESRVIHFIGDPWKRIQEDHLRILRAVRFAHQIQGQYHPDTYQALRESAHLIKTVSGERIRDELNKLLLFPSRANALEDLQDLGILHHILPEVEAMKGIAQPYLYHKEGSVWAHILRSLRSLGKNTTVGLVWSVLLHDIAKPRTFTIEERIRFDGHAELGEQMADDILRRLAFPKKQREQVKWVIKHHMMLLNVLDMSDSARRKWILHPWWPDLLALHKADASGAIPKDLTPYKKVKELTAAFKKRQPKNYPKLISGAEIMERYGLPEGPQIGVLLQLVREGQVEGTVRTKEEAWEIISSRLSRQ